VPCREPRAHQLVCRLPVDGQPAKSQTGAARVFVLRPQGDAPSWNRFSYPRNEPPVFRDPARNASTACPAALLPRSGGYALLWSTRELLAPRPSSQRVVGVHARWAERCGARALRVASARPARHPRVGGFARSLNWNRAVDRQGIRRFLFPTMKSPEVESSFVTDGVFQREAATCARSLRTFRPFSKRNAELFGEALRGVGLAGPISLKHSGGWCRTNSC